MKCVECGRPYSLHPRTRDGESVCWQCIKSERVELDDPDPDEAYMVTVDTEAMCSISSIADSLGMNQGDALDVLLRRAGY